MKYIDDFKFLSPFFKEKSAKIIEPWTDEMNQFALIITAKYSYLTLVEARMMWIMYKMAEMEAVNVNSMIASDMQKEMLNQFK